MSRYQELIRPVWAEIDLTAISHNLQEVRRLVGSQVKIMAVVKAEAYGHGAVEVAQTAMQNGADWLGVSLPEEGIALRNAGIEAPILVFGPLQSHQVETIINYQLTASVCSLETVKKLSAQAVLLTKTANVHIKVDTGMGRVGILPKDVLEFIKALNKLPGIKFDGIFSHFATADEKDKSYAHHQLKIFLKVINNLEKQKLLPSYVHMANSAGVIDIPNSFFNMVRPGLMIYGLYPSQELLNKNVNLLSALSLKAKISHVKRVPRDTGISYGQRYHTKQETTIATIPIGYADGWSRRFFQKVEVLINGKRFPIVGTICMDQCMIDVGDEPVGIDQEVVLIGKQGADEITAEELAEKLDTINYEIVCMISDRVSRIYRK